MVLIFSNVEVYLCICFHGNFQWRFCHTPHPFCRATSSLILLFRSDNYIDNIVKHSCASTLVDTRVKKFIISIKLLPISITVVLSTFTVTKN